MSLLTARLKNSWARILGALANLDKIKQAAILCSMTNTLNISLSEEQKSWLNSRRQAGGFASTSDVVRDLIRSRQEKEQAELLERFRRLDGDGSDEAEPTKAVLKIVKRVKKERRG
jgi:putative addiction module CopG family antidote